MKRKRERQKRKPKITQTDDIDEQKWQEIRNIVIKRANFTCVMCHRKISPPEFTGIYLTAHHIIPRSKGGRSVLKNLRCLCYKCHDIADLEELNAEQIKDYYRDKIMTREEKYIIASKHYPVVYIKRGEKKWHLWVYGGYSKPIIKVIIKKCNIEIIISREEIKEKMLLILRNRNQNPKDWSFEGWFEKKFNMILEPIEFGRNEVNF